MEVRQRLLTLSFDTVYVFHWFSTRSVAKMNSDFRTSRMYRQRKGPVRNKSEEVQYGTFYLYSHV